MSKGMQCYKFMQLSPTCLLWTKLIAYSVALTEQRAESTAGEPESSWSKGHSLFRGNI